MLQIITDGNTAIEPQMANHINAVNNLKKRGAQANPNGRPPKGYSITEMFQAMFTSEPEKKVMLREAIFKKAMEGDIAAQKMVWNYMDGMPKQTTDLHVKELPKPLLSGLEADVPSHNGTPKTKKAE